MASGKPRFLVETEKVGLGAFKVFARWQMSGVWTWSTNNSSSH